MTTLREIRQLIPAQPTSDGDRVTIRRIAGFNTAALSPFLMVDELKSDQRADYVGGFPPHPHRGIETLTYMIQGHFQHRDHMGNVGELRSGGAQWMAAGRGVIHSEMPIMQDGQLLGFQIWINQPAKDKMIPARYHDYQPETITELGDESIGLVRVLAGNLVLKEQTLTGPLTQTGVPAMVADWRSTAGQEIEIKTRSTDNTMVYVYQGNIKVQGKPVRQGEMAVMTKGELLQLVANESSGVLIFNGEPINEPVVHYGPFVMNSVQEIEQAINDFNNGVFDTY